MINKSISILIVNKDSSDFLELSLYALKNLTKNPYKIYIFDTGSGEKDFKKLQKISERHDNVFLERKKINLTPSVEHSTALDVLTKRVKTPYFAVLDADATFLIKDWDEILINKMNKKTPVIGTQAPPGKSQDFPLMFASLFRTKEFKKLNIKFYSHDPSRFIDTGWEMREKYLSAGFKGGLLKYKSTRTYQKGVFRDVICGEYYLMGKNHIFASHFGRGSTTGSAKYFRGWRKYLYSIPVLGKYYLHKKGEDEKRTWLRICRELVDKQAISANKFEELKKCPYCSSNSIRLELSAPDRLTGQSGIFHLSKCKRCGLVFQNPRIKEKFIGEFYTNDLGYYQTSNLKQRKPSLISIFKKMIWKQVLIQHFKYSSLGRASIFWKAKTLFLKRIMKINLIPAFVEGGSLLEIGCSNGAKLEQLRDYGWKVQGVEMGKEVVKYARDKRHLKVQNKRIEECKFEKGSFDVVIMSMVLEYLYDPFTKLKMVDKWIKPGGQLIFSIPWFEGFEFGMFGKHSYGLQLPTHITFMNKKTIIEYLQKLGYKNIKFYHHFFDRDIVASAHFKYLDTGKWLYKFIAYNKLFRLFLVKPFVFLLSLLGRTSRVSVYAQKM